MSALAKTQKAKALELIAQAQACENKKAWFASSKERNLEDAAEAYGQAANAYKVGGFHHEAGDAYVQAGELYRDKLKNSNEAARSFSQAGAFCAAIRPLCDLTFLECFSHNNNHHKSHASL
jgi:alpha-soluble NSF attachment protein